MDIISSGCVFDMHQRGAGYHQRASKLRATIDSIEPQLEKPGFFYFDRHHTQITITNETRAKEVSTISNGILQLNGSGIGGLSDQLRTINKHLSLLNNASYMSLNSLLTGSPTFLVHGPEGCGKTLLLDRFGECPWRKVFRVDQRWLASNRKAQGEALSEVFATARTQQPALVLMDGLDKLLQKAESLLGDLQVELAKLQGTRVVVAAAVRNILDIDACLRTPSGFMTELEIFPPNVTQREDILRQTLGTDRNLANIDFVALAGRSHGFVGRDIHKLCTLARMQRILQVEESLEAENKHTLAERLGDMDLVEQKDFDAVIDQVQPTVLKGSIIEVPKVNWTDIAGVDHVRKELEAITVRPYKVCTLPWFLFLPNLTDSSILIFTPRSTFARRARVCCCLDPLAAQRP
jgi:AAA family ATPase